jgi:hypothetical protein
MHRWEPQNPGVRGKKWLRRRVRADILRSAHAAMIGNQVLNAKSDG